jgi:hypothetical protein
LQRPVDPVGQTAWVAALNNGETRTQVVEDIENGVEYRTVVMQNLYQKFLHRAAEPAAVSALVSFLGSGGTIERVETALAGSPEYFQKRGGGTNDGFLDALYQDAFNRAPDAGGRTYFDHLLAGGASTAQVAAIIFSPHDQEYVQDLVASYYQSYLRRSADSSGLSYFIGVFPLGARDQDVIATLVGSDEYFRRL